MKVDTSPDGSIHIEDRFVLLRWGLLVAGPLSVALAAAQLLSGSGPVRAAWVCLGLALACGAFAAVVEDSDFRFDAVLRQVRWTKRRLIGSRGGTIPFADVDDVVLEVRSYRSDSGLSRTDDCRVFLVTRAMPLPLGSSNLDIRTARDAVAIPLLALLGKSNQALVEDSIRYWISRKDRIRARALAVSALHLDSSRASQLIEELARASRR